MAPVLMRRDVETSDQTFGWTPFGKRSYIFRDLSIGLSTASSSLRGNWPEKGQVSGW